MEIISDISTVLFFLTYFAGQIYLISKILNRIKSKKYRFLKVFVIIPSFIVINSPVCFELMFAMATYPQIQKHTPEWKGYFAIIWFFGISIYGLICFLNDYWQLYKRRKDKKNA